MAPRRLSAEEDLGWSIGRVLEPLQPEWAGLCRWQGLACDLKKESIVSFGDHAEAGFRTSSHSRSHRERSRKGMLTHYQRCQEMEARRIVVLGIQRRDECADPLIHGVGVVEVLHDPLPFLVLRRRAADCSQLPSAEVLSSSARLKLTAPCFSFWWITTY